MDPSSSKKAEGDEDTEALRSLLDVFESFCSLEEIASAYCKAGRDVCKAGDILFQLQESNPNGLLDAQNSEVESAQSEEPVSEDNNKNVKGSKPRTISASMGTVSGVLGKTHVNGSAQSEVGSAQSAQPVPEDNHKNDDGSKSGTIGASMSTVSGVMERTHVNGSAQSEGSVPEDNHKNDEGSKSGTIGALMGTVSGVPGKTHVNGSAQSEVGSAQSEVGFAQSGKLVPEDNHKNVKGSKSRTITASMGTVSGVLGKTYVRHTPSSSQSSETTKPLKIHLNKPLLDESEMEGVPSGSMTRKEPLHKDAEEFLFSMLVGLNLSMDDVREVLGQYGYDVKKSMDKLLAISAKNLEKGKTTDCDEKISVNPQLESSLFKEDHLSHSQGNLAESSKQNKDGSSLPRQVLEALFSAPERFEEEPKRKDLALRLNKRRPGRSVVTGPPDSVPSIPTVDLLWARQGVENVVDDENEYQALRRAVKVHWDAMKAYYEQASEAFAKGDRVQSDYLMKEGQNYCKLAREADEKSTGYYNKMTRKEDEKSTAEISETSDIRKAGIQADVNLDLQAHSAKEAVRLLKIHISSLAGIPSFKYLKVIVDSDAEDATKGKRRRLVTKFLERESITWIEEPENPGAFFIQVDQIDPEELSFAKASE